MSFDVTLMISDDERLPKNIKQTSHSQGGKHVPTYKCTGSRVINKGNFDTSQGNHKSARHSDGDGNKGSHTSYHTLVVGRKHLPRKNEPPSSRHPSPGRCPGMGSLWICIPAPACGARRHFWGLTDVPSVKVFRVRQCPERGGVFGTSIKRHLIMTAQGGSRHRESRRSEHLPTSAA